MKSKFFQLILHQNCEKRHIMTKKKKEKKSQKHTELSSVLGFDKIFHNERLNFILGLIIIAVALFMGLSFISYLSTGAVDQSMIEDPQEGEILNQHHEFMNTCGSLGAYTSWFFIKRCFGLPSFLIPLFLLFMGVHLTRAYKINLLKWFLSLMILMIWASVAMSLLLAPLFTEACYSPGGDHGLYICNYLGNLVGTPGLTVVLGLTAIAFLTYISAETIFVVRKLLNPTRFIDKVKFKITNNDPEENTNSYDHVTGYDDVEDDPEVFDDPATQTVEFKSDGKAVVIDNVFQNESEKSGKSGEKRVDTDVDFKIDEAKGEETADKKTVAPLMEDLEPYDPKRDLENYRYPTLDLLKKYDNDGKPFIDMAEQTANKNRIVEVLRNFGVEIASIKATVGPTITLYEITLAPGVRIARVRSLEDDIALSLSALGIRIIAPIPGKGTIGIEVPNAKPSIVSMESILNSRKFQESQMELPCALGKTITNEVFMFDLAKAPHLLVAGATGQGKSVGLNAIVTSLLYKKHPAELKIVLVDPKKVEFSIYNPLINHFLAKVPDDDADPIITDVTKVVRTLNSRPAEGGGCQKYQGV